MPTLVMAEPILEIAWPLHSLRKSRLRVRPPKSISQVSHVADFIRSRGRRIVESSVYASNVSPAADRGPGTVVGGAAGARAPWHGGLPGTARHRGGPPGSEERRKRD